MIDIDIFIRRGFWSGDMEKRVAGYLKELEEFKAGWRTIGWSFSHSLLGGSGFSEKIIAMVDEEINFCKFWQNYCMERMYEPNFNQWIFQERKEEGQHERWVKTNGRVKAEVIIDRTGPMAKLYINYGNDNDIIKFIDPYERLRGQDACHLKNEEAIQNRVAALKMKADGFLNSRMYPLGLKELKNHEDLKALLVIS